MSVHSDLEAAYKDLESLNTRLMASLEDTAVQLRMLHSKGEEDQAKADAERCDRADAVAELAMARAMHEAELERVSAEGQQIELEFRSLLEAAQCDLDEAEARAAQCQVWV